MSLFVWRYDSETRRKLRYSSPPWWFGLPRRDGKRNSAEQYLWPFCALYASGYLSRNRRRRGIYIASFLKKSSSSFSPLALGWEKAEEG